MRKLPSRKAVTTLQSVIIAVLIIIALAASIYFFTLKPKPTPTTTPSPTSSPTPTPPYLAKFRQQPELFVTHTQKIHMLFEDEEGNLLANLTGVCQTERVDTTVYATLNYSFSTDPKIANITFESGINWIIVKGSYPMLPVPMPPPRINTYTLQHGETVVINRWSDDFELAWEWVQFEAGALLYNFELGFVDGNVWRDFEPGETGQIYDWVNYHGTLFPFLHNNPIETETVSLKVLAK